MDALETREEPDDELRRDAADVRLTDVYAPNPSWLALPDQAPRRRTLVGRVLCISSQPVRSNETHEGKLLTAVPSGSSFLHGQGNAMFILQVPPRHAPRVLPVVRLGTHPARVHLVHALVPLWTGCSSGILIPRGVRAVGDRAEGGRLEDQQVVDFEYCPWLDGEEVTPVIFQRDMLGGRLAPPAGFRVYGDAKDSFGDGDRRVGRVRVDAQRRVVGRDRGGFRWMEGGSGGSSRMNPSTSADRRGARGGSRVDRSGMSQRRRHGRGAHLGSVRGNVGPGSGRRGAFGPRG